MLAHASQRSLAASLALVAVLALSQTSSRPAIAGAHAQGGFMSSLLWPFTRPFRRTGEPESDASAGPGSGGFGWSRSGPLAGLRNQTFQMFAHLYNKSYSPEELPRRMRLFFERRREIEASARAYAAGKLPFMMRENAYVDWDAQELKRLTGVAPPRRPDEFTPEDRQALLGAERQLRRRRRRRSVPSGPGSLELADASEPFEFDYQLQGNHSLEELRRSSDGRDGDGEFDFYEERNSADGNTTNENYNNQSNNDNNVDDDDDPDFMVMAPERIPASKDWRASGCVAAPINQARCGACYAIATMGVLETMRCLNRVSSPTLAPQQVVDCSRAYNNLGCDGGWPTRVLKYLQDVRVAAREVCYPFVRRQLACRLRQVQAMGQGCTVSASPSDSRLTYKVLNNERDILYHVASTGPVVTVMRATDKFLYYGSGIFDDAACSRRRDDVDHAIVIVGYGRRNGQDYWLIKNSWGESWGQQGYGLYKRGTNACSIGHWGWVITS